VTRIEHHVKSAPHTDKKAEARLIKRYANRKLYDARASKYITLEGIRDLVRAGHDVSVIDNDTGEDITRVTFAQIIYEDEKRKGGMGSLPLLRWVVERGDEARRDFMRSMERGREALETMREATEKRVQRLITAPQRQLDSLQHSIDEQLERVTSHPAIRSEIKRIEKNIKLLEKQLARLTHPGGVRKVQRMRTRTGTRGRR
jgi:polyhydroxyalkanoate synthesis repressor PhaR